MNNVPSILGAITPNTFLDYPGHLSAIFWFYNCNLRCPYCYNPHWVSPLPGEEERFHPVGRNEITTFLEERKLFLDAVVMSGGECTLSPSLPEVCREVKRAGLKVKVDTNGLRPDMLQTLLDESLLDTVALDAKAPERKWGLFSDLSGSHDRWQDSLRILLNSGIDFEVRTTVHPDILNEADLSELSIQLFKAGYRKTWFIQPFFDSGSRTLGNVDSHPRELDFDKINSPLPIIVRKG